MGVGFAQQVDVARLLGGVENNAHIHHDVDKERILGHEGAQVLALFLESHSHRLPCLDDDIVKDRIATEIVPAFPGRPENEAQIVDIAVVFARFEQQRIVLGPLSP